MLQQDGFFALSTFGACNNATCHDSSRQIFLESPCREMSFYSQSFGLRPVHFRRLQRAVTPVGRISLRVHAAVEAFGGRVRRRCGLVEMHGVDEALGGRGRGGRSGFMEANGFVVDVGLEVVRRDQAQIRFRQGHY